MDQYVSYIFNAVLTVALGLITARLKTEMERINDRNASLQAKVEQENKAIRKGVQSLLRAQMIKDYEHYYIEVKHCPIHVKDSFHANYMAYHNLGENGVMDQIYEDFMALPNE